MSHTISVRLPEETARRLDARAKEMGRSRSAVVKEVLERSLEGEPKSFMKLAGSVEGPKHLSGRKGFSKK